MLINSVAQNQTEVGSTGIAGENSGFPAKGSTSTLDTKGTFYRTNKNLLRHDERSIKSVRDKIALFNRGRSAPPAPKRHSYEKKAASPGNITEKDLANSDGQKRAEGSAFGAGGTSFESTSTSDFLFGNGGGEKAARPPPFVATNNQAIIPRMSEEKKESAKHVRRRAVQPSKNSICLSPPPALGGPRASTKKPPIRSASFSIAERKKSFESMANSQEDTVPLSRVPKIKSPLVGQGTRREEPPPPPLPAKSVQKPRSIVNGSSTPCRAFLFSSQKAAFPAGKWPPPPEKKPSTSKPPPSGETELSKDKKVDKLDGPANPLVGKRAMDELTGKHRQEGSVASHQDSKFETGERSSPYLHSEPTAAKNGDTTSAASESENESNVGSASFRVGEPAKSHSSDYLPEESTEWESFDPAETEFNNPNRLAIPPVATANSSAPDRQGRHGKMQKGFLLGESDAQRESEKEVAKLPPSLPPKSVTIQRLAADQWHSSSSSSPSLKAGWKTSPKSGSGTKLRKHETVSVNDIRRAFEKAEQSLAQSMEDNSPPLSPSPSHHHHHHRAPSMDSTTSEESLLFPVPQHHHHMYGSVSSLLSGHSSNARDHYGSISSLASSTSLISPHVSLSETK